MLSIQDVADQINAKLDNIKDNTAATVAVGNGIRNDLGLVNTARRRLGVPRGRGTAG
jgi:hypothetical protein